jgi:hypothetical protein
MLFAKDRIRAAGLHFLFSIAIAAVAAAVIFGLWYPYPFRDISGGRSLFILVTSVDVIVGPLITLAIFNKAKGWSVLKKDLMVVAALQLVALGYGTWTVFMARPVHIVYEYDRFAVVHAIEVPRDMLDEAAVPYRSLPLTGPTLLSLRQPTDLERRDFMMDDVTGTQPLSTRPALWQAYEAARPTILAKAKPVVELQRRFPAAKDQIDLAVRATKRSAEQLVYAPLVGREQFWTVLLDNRTAEVLQYIPLDPF